MNELIERVKKQLEYRAKMIGVFNPNTTRLIHTEHGNFIYVICNVLIEDYDKDLRPYQRYLVSYTDPVFNKPPDGYVTDGGKFMYNPQDKTFFYNLPKLCAIPFPQLLARINKESLRVEYGGCFP
jgi:hypothetical protein